MEKPEKVLNFAAGIGKDRFGGKIWLLATTRKNAKIAFYASATFPQMLGDEANLFQEPVATPNLTTAGLAAIIFIIYHYQGA